MNKHKIELIFFHIYKCGGTTFNWLLQENFPDKVIYAESPINAKNKYLSKEILNKNLYKLMQRKEIKAISSHNMSASCLDLGEIAFSILRHPKQRNWSAYNFQNTTSNNISYEDYLIKNSNFQFKVLTKGKKGDKKKMVMDLLDNFKFGILERFDESMLFLEWICRKRGLNLDLSYSNNLNSQIYGKKLTIDKDEEINKKMIDFYKLDLILYAEANKKLDYELKNIPNLENKLSEFKFRCEKLRKIKYKGKRDKYGQGPESFHFMT